MEQSHTPGKTPDPDHKDWHQFSVLWHKEMRFEDWNEICAWAVEQFGLPGNRFITQAGLASMTFHFRDAQDYEWMLLRWS